MTKEVEDVFKSYPENVRVKLLVVRQLIIETAAEMNEFNKLDETLKWGEPSYLIKTGSTIRIGWKVSKPDQYALYFHCKTTLVDTFKELYSDRFTFEGNRAIILSTNQKIPLNELKHCIFLSLNYHKIKHLTLLGV